MPIRDQRPPIGETQRRTVKRGDEYPYDEATIEYQRRQDGWYVKTPEDDEFWMFAKEYCKDVDVRVLIAKKWCRTYAVDPDDFTERV